MERMTTMMGRRKQRQKQRRKQRSHRQRSASLRKRRKQSKGLKMERMVKEGMMQRRKVEASLAMMPTMMRKRKNSVLAQKAESCCEDLALGAK
jgi:hypothetical protein